MKNKMDEYPTESEIKTVKSLITYCKNTMLNPEEIEALGEKEKLPLLETYKEYNACLRSNQQMDYDDQRISRRICRRGMRTGVKKSNGAYLWLMKNSVCWIWNRKQENPDNSGSFIRI
ncbi:MAG: hypothetical protein J6N53_13435 [Lachnospiraceae bacterium]|nr:hypothetical protein [Lachnospiraceae bacterium]MBO6299836.1 hypothetical protein [Lachnospiraceae bacterium]MBP3295576.1 hypothetical protein [Lachnospiraceae bacterium]